MTTHDPALTRELSRTLARLSEADVRRVLEFAASLLPPPADPSPPAGRSSAACPPSGFG